MINAFSTYSFSNQSVAEKIWMILSCTFSSLVVVKAIKVSLSQFNDVDALTKALVSLVKVFSWSISYATCMSSVTLFWLHITKSTSLARAFAL